MNGARLPIFRFASEEAFRKRCPQFSDILHWESGLLWSLINSESVFQQLAAFSLNGLPAVSSITHILAPILEPVDQKAKTDKDAARLGDRLRQAIGSMVREVLHTNGFRKTGRLRAVAPRPRRLFVRAEVFEILPLDAATPQMNGFSWDDFAASATFGQMVRLSPELSGRLPSMYSPDRRWFYLSSQDVDVPTSCEESLRALMRLTKEDFRSELESTSSNYTRMGKLKRDFYELCHMLSILVKDSEEFSDPEAMLTRRKSTEIVGGNSRQEVLAEAHLD